MGPCVQKIYESYINQIPPPCFYDNVEYSLNSFIIEEAKKRGLVE
jgi:hypothetical protein